MQGWRHSWGSVRAARLRSQAPVPDVAWPAVRPDGLANAGPSAAAIVRQLQAHALLSASAAVTPSHGGPRQISVRDAQIAQLSLSVGSKRARSMGRGKLFNQFILVSLLFCLLVCFRPNVSMATEIALRGITDLQLTIGSPPDAPADCRVDDRHLERVGIERLLQAGLQAITVDEVIQRNQAMDEQLRRDLDTIRSGQRLSPAASQALTERRSAALFLRNLPGLMIQLDTHRRSLPHGEIVCALAVSADFSVPPVGAPHVAVSGQAVFAPLIVWRHPTLAAASSPSDIKNDSSRILASIIGSFVEVWSRENRRVGR